MGQTNKIIGNLKRSVQVVTMFWRDIKAPQILGQTDANRILNSRVQSLVVSERTWMKRHKLGRCRGKSGYTKCTKCLLASCWLRTFWKSRYPLELWFGSSIGSIPAPRNWRKFLTHSHAPWSNPGTSPGFSQTLVLLTLAVDGLALPKGPAIVLECPEKFYCIAVYRKIVRLCITCGWRDAPTC